MKKVLLSLLALVLVLGGLAYQNQTALLLALVKYKSANEYEVGPPRDLPWSAGPAQAGEEPGERPPNIILIVADDLGYNDISTFGGGVAGGRVQTPHIDQLAAEGAVFTQSYSGAGTCAPSRAMMMTGRYPTRTGFEFTPTPSGMAPVVSRISADMDSVLPPAIYDAELDASRPPYEEQGLPAEEVTIAEILRERGYQTFHIGKWHLGRQNGMAPHEQGFDQSLLMASGLFLPEDDPNVVNAKLEFDPIDQFLWARMVYANSFNTGDEDRFEPGGYLTDYWTDESIKIIEANKNRPFFLYLAHWGVHTPLQATREDYEAVGDIQPHRLRVYAAMIRALDRSVGRINAALGDAGLADNTIVLFTSDNGGPGYIGLPDINHPFRGWKISQFEGGIRVPLFVKWPARIAAGTVSEEPVAHIDMMPTLAAAAEAPQPEGVVIDGENLLPLATGDGAEQWDRETLFWQSGHYRVVRHGDWKLQVAARPDKQWLFNLAEDPTEQNNLAATEPQKLAQLQALLDAHAASARPPLYPAATELSIAIDKTLAEPFAEGDEYIYWPN
ncbi:sulfatase [Pseudohalioglobus sediminis]|uniref:Sulfatase n=1 Tax=Pseudohalioglobus sediminis TaxID=2606449 RepID=A0A5B0X1S1_9GAMM|nr:sulfatase [Pseudohalioglobus sediminis]KAA1193236.1 sulfatase [Pseudohalioglobus sediminis]